MNDPPATQPSLLVRMRDPSDNGAWIEFVDIYTPLVFGFLRRRGLQEADAADVVQDVFRAVSQSIGDFKLRNGQGSFRAWLLTVTRSKLCDHANRQKRQVQGRGDTQNMQLLAQEPISSGEQALIEREYAERLFERACASVKPEFRENTWRAFLQTEAEGIPAKDVAAQLSMSVDAVYVARCRVMARLRERIAELQE